MPPCPARPTIARLRRATTFAPSVRDSPPATTAAAISPCEWPTTASGTTPNARQSRASDTITAKSAGCTTSTRSSPSPERTTSSSDHSVKGASAAWHSSIEAANGADSVRSSRAIPSHCVPCPGNTNTVPPVVDARPSATNGEGSPAATARRPSRSSRRSPATTARYSCSARVPTSDRPTSPARTSAPQTCARRAACSRSAPADLADTTHGTGVPGSPAAGASGSGSGSGTGCSTITCALVPLIPNPEIPARRGPSPGGQGVASVSRRTSPAFQSTYGVGSVMCRDRGSRPYRIARTIFSTPPTPAAAWVWPMLDFSEPSHNGLPSRRC